MTCSTCKWSDKDAGACCNSNSPHRADFVNPKSTCKAWEGMPSQYIERQKVLDMIDLIEENLKRGVLKCNSLDEKNFMYFLKKMRDKIGEM